MDITLLHASLTELTEPGYRLLQATEHSSPHASRINVSASCINKRYKQHQPQTTTNTHKQKNNNQHNQQNPATPQSFYANSDV
jgi:hypothetical protein